LTHGDIAANIAESYFVVGHKSNWASIGLSDHGRR